VGFAVGRTALAFMHQRRRRFNRTAPWMAGGLGIGAALGLLAEHCAGR
jgi:hypothetical protein